MPSIRHRILLTMLVASCAIAASAVPAAAGTLIDDGTLGPALGTSGTFAAPQGVALAPDGSLYVMEASGFRVVKLGPDKSFERMWGRDVKVGAPDAFEVCLAGESCKAGVQASNFGSAQGGELFGSSYVDVAPNGTVYITDGRRVQVFGSDGQFQRMWGVDVDSPDGGSALEVCTVAASCLRGELSNTGGGFNGAAGIAVAANGDVVVTDIAANRVQRFGSDGSFIHAIGWDVVSGGGTGFEICTVAANCKEGVSGPGEGQFQTPHDVSIKGAETLVASDNDYVQRFAADGTYLGRFGGFSLTPNPAGMDVSPAGEVFLVQDSGGPRGLHRFGTDYAYVEFLGGLTNNLNDEPDDVAIDGTGRAYVPQPFRNVVRRFLVGAATPTPPGPTPPAPVPTPAPTPPATPAPKPAAIKASTVITLPSTRACVSRRNFRIRLRHPRGTTIAQATVSLNGKKVKTVKGKRVTAPVDLRSLPKGRFTVKVTITTADGRKVSDSRRYRTCVPKKR